MKSVEKDNSDELNQFSQSRVINVIKKSVKKESNSLNPIHQCSALVKEETIYIWQNLLKTKHLTLNCFKGGFLSEPHFHSLSCGKTILWGGKLKF